MTPSTAFDLQNSIVSDPILDLCPSLDLLVALARSPNVDREAKRQRLSRALLRASSNGDTDILSWLLDSRAEARELLASPDAPRDSAGRPKINFDQIKDEDGTGPVVLAACAGHVDAVTHLILNGADVDERDACGWTPLMWATNSSNLTLVSFLLSHGADVEARSSKGTSCEDFILSAAPDAAKSPDPALSASITVGAGPSRSPHTDSSQQQKDKDHIADLIYEHQRMALSQQTNTQRLRNLSFSSPPSTPDRQSSPRKSALPLLESTPGASSSGFRPGHSRTSSQITASRRLVGRSERVQLAERELKSREVAEGRKRALLDIAVMLELNYANLVGEQVQLQETPSAPTTTSSSRRRRAPKVVSLGLASGCGAAEVGADILSVEFDWNTVRSDQMLVFGMSDLQALLDLIITDVKPLRAPWTSRAAPANVLFLCARYACFFGDEDLLEELILGAIDRIEGSIYANPTDMSYLAFWLYNCCLLHHYTQKDVTLRASASVKDYRGLIADLINEIYVFVIRDAERRIDKVLDAAILDHEAIPGFEEVRFEGEWKFIKTLTGSVKGMSQQGISSPVPNSNSSNANARKPISQIFGRWEGNENGLQPPGSPALGIGTPPTQPGSLGRSSGSPLKPPGSPSPAGGLGAPVQGMREVSCNATAADLLVKPSPRTITSLLTSTLHVLQLYEINPAIIIQGLSQIFFWVGCELFNRVITRKRYLCRSRAMQIRLNVSALEDWARSNALPLAIVHAHLSPLSQLVSWLQCQSSLNEFDGLIATMQGLKSLNPLQMRKAVKDYRYEVGESRMSEECVQYLDQLIIDWRRRQEDLLRQHEVEARAIERRKKQRKSSAHHRSGTATQNGPTPDSRSPSPSNNGDEDMPLDISSSFQGDTSVETTVARSSPEPLSVTEAVTRSAQNTIDSLFLSGKSMADYVPPWSAAGAPPGASETAWTPSELLNSRDMLPFAIPSRADALVVTPGDAFGFGRGHFTGTGTPSLRSEAGSDSSRPGSPVSDAGSVSSTTSRSSLFPTGRGLAAGASWSPVPLLPDGLLETISETMRPASNSPIALRPDEEIMDVEVEEDPQGQVEVTRQHTLKGRK